MVKPLQPDKLSQWALAAVIVIVLFSMSFPLGMNPSLNTVHSPGVGAGVGAGGVGGGVGTGVVESTG